ncbi:hypothetical protein QBC43DRAFT_300695 [Cladorrhinum sp. PSN259]|nr:hypothetical protein QBC43DRAFT_300695 [Cladorrhinum sp. PSN259]
MSSSRSLRQLLHWPRSRSASTAPHPSPPSNASPEKISAPQARIISAAPAAVSDPYTQGLKIVAEGINPLVDIVAIHGLNGHRDKTWTASNGVHWLRDLLPNDIPHARIFCWGYDANTHATSRVSCQYLYNHARTLISDLSRKRKLSDSMERPIIFVAHSLGGIVLKSALIYSDAARRGALEEHRSIKVSTHGVIFMGTPHQGGNGVQLGRLLVNIASLFMPADDRILKHLERDSEWLQQQLDHYGPISGDFMTKFAYEEYETPTALGHSIMVVPRISAVVPGQPDAEPIAIHADHINMVRYTLREEGGYITISETLQIIVSAAPEAIRRRWEVERRVDEARLSSSDSAFPNGFSLPEIKQRRALNEWLDPTPTSDTFDLIRSQRFKDSCEWICKHRFFHLWLTEPRWRVCHMDGPPGYGKSTIVTKLIEDLRSNHPVAFFFCRVREARQGWKDIIRTWIWQLLEQRPQPELITGVYNIYASTLGIATTPLSTYFKALIWLVKKLDTSFIFLDGMDENPELAELGDQRLTMHFYDLSRHAKVFTVSRPDPSVRYTIPTNQGGFIRLAINDEFNRKDIETFLADEINKLGWNEERSKWIHMKLVEGANGMFLWAKLMLQVIREQVRADDLETVLEKLPDGLPAVYSRILAKIATLPAPRARAAASTLQWAYAATRPLTLPELEAALAVKPASATSQRDERHGVINIRQLITDYCGSLLEIHERSGTIQFAHASAIQYLESVSAKKESTPYDVDHFPLVLAKRGPHLAATCLTYLTYDDIDYVRPNESLSAYAGSIDQHLQNHPFLRYAAIELWTHFPSVEDDISTSSKELAEAISRFFEKEKNLVKWLQLYQLLGGISANENRGEDRFHPESDRFAGLVRSQTILQKLGCPAGNKLFSRWDRWTNEDFFNGHYCTPITIAAFFDLTGVLQQQLNEGVPADDDLVFGITPFLYAVHGDASEAAKLLIDKGADPACISKAGYGAARYASRNCLSVLPVVLGIDGPWATQRDKDEGITVFHNVVSTVGWHPCIVGGFFDLSNAEALDQLDFLGQTALHRAANISTDKAVNIIRGRLTGSADTGYGKDKNDRKILSSSLEEVFTPNTNTGIQTWAQAWREFFCSNDSNADLSDFPQQTASLTSANIRTLVRKIRAHILRELVLRKPKLNVQDRLSRTALHIAVNAAGADDEAEETISPAVTLHRPPTVKDNTNSKDNWQKLESPLEILLVAGADPFVRDSAGRLAVEIAIARRHWHSARLLFEAMRLKVNLSKDDEDNIQHLRLLLDETRIEQSSPSFKSRETEWMQHRVGFPKSYRDMVETSLILHSRLRSSPSLQGYTQKALLNGVVRRILDCASYWGPSARAVDVSTSVAGDPRLALSLKVGRVRKIELFLAAPHRGSRVNIKLRRPRLYDTTLLMYYALDDHLTSYYRHGRLYCDSGSRDDDLQRAGDQLIFNDDQVLRWVVDTAASPPILGDQQLWNFQYTDYELDIWKQSWPLGETNSGNYGELRRMVKDWMGDLKEGDTVVLKTAEGFSIQDVSMFSRFGVVFYLVV